MLTYRKNFLNASVILVATLIVNISDSAIAAESEWKMYSTATVMDEQSMCFYDVKSILTNANNNMKVWTKCISEKELDYKKLPLHQKLQIITEFGRRLSSGEKPPVARIEKLDEGALNKVKEFEATANSGYVNSNMEGLMEINCRERMQRILRATISYNGSINTSDKSQDWRDIAPDSNASGLMILVCP